MKKITDFLKDYGILILVILSCLILMKDCGTSNSVSKIKKDVDSLKTKTLDKKDVELLIKETPALESLILEEDVDQKRVSFESLKLQRLSTRDSIVIKK